MKKQHLLAAVFLLLPMYAMAQTASTGVVKQRQDIMDGMWPKYFQKFGEAAKSSAPDYAQLAALSAAAATDLKTVATLFPEGSGRPANPTSRARPEVWSERAEFDRNLRVLTEETEKIGEAARSGQAEAVKAQILKASLACGACHSGRPKEGGKFRFEASP